MARVNDLKEFVTPWLMICPNALLNPFINSMDGGGGDIIRP